MRERYRKVAHLTKQFETIRQETEREVARQVLLEDQLKKGLVDKFMKEQRRVIIEERKEESAAWRKARMERDKQEKIKQAQLLEQISMLKEQIQEAEEEERLIRQGEQEVAIIFFLEWLTNSLDASIVA